MCDEYCVVTGPVVQGVSRWQGFFLVESGKWKELSSPSLGLSLSLSHHSHDGFLSQGFAAGKLEPKSCG